MTEEENDRSVSRRQFLGVGSAAVGATMIAVATAAAQIPQDTEKAEHDRSGSSPLGPDDEALGSENSDSVTPPPSDHGDVKAFKYPFSFSHKRIQEGGWARQGDNCRLAGLDDDRGRGYAPHRGRYTRVALAHGWRVGPYALRQRANNVPGSIRQTIC